MGELQTPGEENQLEQFVLRLLAPPLDQRNHQPRLFPGTLPEDLPIDVPVPENGRVLGTLVRSAEQIEIVLESNLTPEEVVAFYRTQLASQGWSEPEDFMRPHMGGFTHAGFGPHNYITFCQGVGASLTLNIAQRENAVSDIRVHINLSSEGNPCNQQRRLRHQRYGHYDMLPPLAPPAGTQQRGGGGSSGDTEAHSTATLKTDLALDALIQHYSEQLSKSGWTRSSEGTSGPIAWHTWKFTDEDQQSWNGMFFILHKPDKAQEYALYVWAELEQPENESRFSGWFNSSSSSGTILPPQ